MSQDKGAVNMLKIFKRRKNGEKRRSTNNDGLTLVEVIVGTAIFGILAGMICTAANFSMRSQSDTEKWNKQTDMQTSYLSQNRDDLTIADATGGQYDDGTGNATLKINFNGDIKDTGDHIFFYSVNTQYEYNDGYQLPTDEDHNIKFFRVE